MSLLSVSGPIPPRPPARDTLGSVTTMTTYSIPNFEEDDRSECIDGEHVFQSYAAPSRGCCNICNQQILTGTRAHSCEECDVDLCEACFAAETSNGSARKAKLYNSLPVSKNQGKLGAVAEDACSVGSSESETSTEAFSDSDRSSPQSDSCSSRGKECISCERPYTGYGHTCGECRKSGRMVHQCRDCSHYFRGFSNLCDECKPATPGQAQPGKPDFHLPAALYSA